MAKKETYLDKVSNYDEEGKIIRSFYGGDFHAYNMDKNFVHLSIAQGNGMAKLNRKDVENLKGIIDEVLAKMDSN